MAYHRLRSFIVLPMLTIVAVTISLCDALATAYPRPFVVRLVYDYPLHAIREIGFLADYAMSAAEQIKLQAALAIERLMAESSATLKKLLRLIDIRTALEDTRRLRFDLG